jgi:hypothetical protein
MIERDLLGFNRGSMGLNADFLGGDGDSTMTSFCGNHEKYILIYSYLLRFELWFNGDLIWFHGDLFDGI